MRHLNAQRLLNGHAQAVAIDVGGHIVQTLGVEQRLRIGEALAQFLDAAVYVTTHHVHLFHHLAVERHAIAHHTVRRGVLRAKVYHIFVVGKHLALNLLHLAVLVLDIAAGVVLVLLVVEAQRVEVGVVVVVLAQRVSHPVVAQEKAAHVGVSHKHDAKEVIYLALLEQCHSPEVAHRGQMGVLALGGGNLHVQHLLRGGVGEVVHHAQLLFPVHAHQRGEVVEVEIIAQRGGQRVPLLGSNGHKQNFASCIKLSLGAQRGNLLL